MKRKVAIYLAGSIKKGHENPNESFWTDEDMADLKSYLSDYEIAFLNPAFRSDDLSDQLSVFGRDMTQVFSAHVVFVDARDRRGLGVGAEMMWAKINQIPVVTLAPKNSHYHKEKTTILGVDVEDFIHPFVLCLSDKLAENLADGAEWIKKSLSDPAVKIKGIEEIAGAMQHYKERQLARDEPMKEMLRWRELETRMLRALPQVTLRS